jgi:epoxyqueuosine reductase
VVALGHALGLAAVGVTSAEPLLRARAALEDRQQRDLVNGMAFTFKNPLRSTSPERALGSARSIVVGAHSYLLEQPPAPDEPSARVARYAWLDHYAPLRAALRDIAAHLRSLGWRAAVYADDNSLVDREVAWRAGIGWYGKNANLLVPRAGSWFVLGSVVTDAELEPVAAPVADGCGGCRRCLDACPTGAIPEPGVIDANRCLAWLLQKPGVFPHEHRRALGDRIYGCDDCQEACPPNVRWAEARRRPNAAVAWVPIVELLSLGDDELIERHGSWYIHGREVRWVRRNALLVLGNTADGRQEAVAATLRRYLGDRDPMLRAPAVWAAARLGRHDLLPERDDDPMVNDELARSRDHGVSS